MSQLILNAIGDIEQNTELVEAPDLTVGAGEALVRIEAAAINPVDFMLAAGHVRVPGEVPFALGHRGRRPGRRQSGDPELQGKRVLIVPNYQQGTWADEVVVKAENLVGRSPTRATRCSWQWWGSTH